MSDTKRMKGLSQITGLQIKTTECIVLLERSLRRDGSAIEGLL